MRNSLSAAALIAVFGFHATTALAQHGEAHTHGMAKLEMVAESGSVQVEFRSPGADITGFEHEAETAEEKAREAAARKLLLDASNIVSFPEAAACRHVSGNIEEEHHGHEEHHDDHAKHDEHEKHHDHDHAKHDEHEKHDDHAKHDEHEGHEEHGEYHVTHLFVCDHPDKLDGVTVTVFSSFPTLEEVDLAAVVDGRQFAAELTPGNPGARFGD